MPTFEYVAKRNPTETVEGLLEADNRAGAINQLLGLGYTPLRVAEKAQGTRASPGVRQPLPATVQVPHRQFNRLTRQLASLIRSQVPILRALMILVEQTEHPRLRRVIQAIEDDIRQGSTLSAAMAKFPRVFSPLYISLIQSGEVGGMLDTVLDRLAEETDREEALRAKIQAALAYPLFVVVVGILTVFFLLAYVIPRLVKLFTLFGKELPLPTRILLWLGDSFSKGWYGYAACLGLLIVTGWWFARSEQGMVALAYLRLRLPLIRSLVRQLETTRFARSFGLLLDHGVPVLKATDVAIPVVENRVLRKELRKLPQHLKEGNTLSSGLKGMTIASPLLINTVAVGEESGKIGEALLEVANFCEREVERLLQTLTALLEPMTILLVGGVVGFIVMAVLLPILTMGTVVR